MSQVPPTQALVIAKANNCLTITDSTSKNAWIISGAASIQMDYLSSTVARYTIFDCRLNISFNLSEITTIGGAGANANPTTALGQLKAVLPLYA